MAYRLKVSARAVREIGEAYEWYEEQLHGLGALKRASLRRHADGAVQADDFSVEHFVFDDVTNELGVVRGLAQPRRERHLLGGRLLHVFRHAEQHRRLEDSRRDGAQAGGGA